MGPQVKIGERMPLQPGLAGEWASGQTLSSSLGPGLLPTWTRANCPVRGRGPSGTAASVSRPVPGEGCLPVARRPCSSHWALVAAMLLVLSFLPLLFLLMLPASSHAWTRPLWYQVGLDLQPWGCQQNNLDACERSISCPGYWVSLGGKNIYPVAGVTLTTTMMLMFSRAMLQRWRSQGAKGEVSAAAPSPDLRPGSSHPHTHCLSTHFHWDHTNSKSNTLPQPSSFSTPILPPAAPGPTPDPQLTFLSSKPLGTAPPPPPPYSCPQPHLFPSFLPSGLPLRIRR